MKDFQFPTPREKYPALQPLHDEIIILMDEHIEWAKSVLSVSKGLFKIDTLVLAFLKRSMDISSAIVLLVDRWNLNAAGALLRLQLDSLVKYRFLLMVSPRDQLVDAILAGERWSQCRDPRAFNGKKKLMLTDKHLNTCAETDFPWLQPVYDKLSSLIHFSESHVDIITDVTEESGTYSLFVGYGTHDWPESGISEFLQATRQCLIEMRRLTAIHCVQKHDGLAKEAGNAP